MGVCQSVWNQCAVNNVRSQFCHLAGGHQGARDCIQLHSAGQILAHPTLDVFWSTGEKPLRPNRHPVQFYPGRDHFPALGPRRGLSKKRRSLRTRRRPLPAGRPPHWTCRPLRSPSRRTPRQGSPRLRSRARPPPPSGGPPGRTGGWRRRWSTRASPSCRSAWTGPRPRSRTPAATWRATSGRGSFGPRSPRNEFNEFCF